MTDWVTDTISRLYWKVVRFLGNTLGSDWPLVVRNLNLIVSANKASTKQALLYYKTEPFIFPERLDIYEHTNLWEITEIVRVLNTFGFVVDVVDRSASAFQPTDQYDLYIGLGAGHSGKYFAKYAEAMPRAVKVLLAAGPEPRLSNRLVQEQYDRFNARHGAQVPAMRLTEGIDFEAFTKYADYFLAIGEADQFCARSYAQLGKLVLTYLPGVSPRIRFLDNWVRSRSRKKFLCFAGNGLICKGVDVVVEAFLEMPELDLHICGPDTEPSFFDVLGARIKNSRNVRFEGFVKVGGARFEELMSECAFVIFASSSEGCATSVATVMKGGLVPILTEEVGIGLGSFGYSLRGPRDRLIDEIKAVSSRAAQVSDEEYRERVYATLQESLKFTQASFTQSLTTSILSIMKECFG